jgi:hypothetical protein
MTSLYQQIGMNDYYDEHFSKSLDFYKHKTAEDNARDFFKLFVPDFKPIAQSRFQSLALDSSRPNNRSEQLYKNILLVFRKIHYQSHEAFQLNLIEIRELIAYIFKDVIDMPKYRKFTKKKSLFNEQTISLREILETYLEDINKLIKEKTIEPIFLYVNFMVDFINMRIFDFKYNDIIGTLIFYILMLEQGLKASHFIGFFPKLYTRKDRYFNLLNQSSYQWEEGLADVVPLTLFFIQIYGLMYEDLNDLSRDLKFDQDLNILKTDFVENIVLKMPETFSKKDIRKKYPHVSDSTINRTLKRLQDENKIRSLGKGRSAKWVKIIENDDIEGQLKLFLGDD